MASLPNEPSLPSRLPSRALASDLPLPRRASFLFPASSSCSAAVAAVGFGAGGEYVAMAEVAAVAVGFGTGGECAAAVEMAAWLLPGASSLKDSLTSDTAPSRDPRLYLVR